MQRLLIRAVLFTSLLAPVGAATLFLGQTPPANAGASPTLQAELLKNIDVSHSRVGDEVTARTVIPLEAAGTNYPAGTTVQGRITDVGPNRLALVFDHLLPKKAAPIPVALSLRAVMMPHGTAAGQAATGSDQMSPQSQSLGGGRASPGVDTAIDGNLMRSPQAAARDSSDTTFKGPRPDSVVKTANGGVIGVPGLHLQVSSDPKVGSTFEFEKGSRVRLDKGLQMMFVISQR
jgi:hypothetical protein